MSVASLRLLGLGTCVSLPAPFPGPHSQAVFVHWGHGQLRLLVKIRGFVYDKAVLCQACRCPETPLAITLCQFRGWGVGKCFLRPPLFEQEQSPTRMNCLRPLIPPGPFCAEVWGCLSWSVLIPQVPKGSRKEGFSLKSPSRV